MNYRFGSYKINFFIVMTLLGFDCFLYGGERNELLAMQNSHLSARRRQRSEDLEPQIAFSQDSLTSLGSSSRSNSVSSSRSDSPVPAKPIDLASCAFEEMSAYSMVGNKSVTPQFKEYTACGLYAYLLEEQSNKIVSDFCREAGIEVHDLYLRVRDLRREHPGIGVVNSGNNISPVMQGRINEITNFFSARGYGHTTITIKQEDGWGKPSVNASCEGVTIRPSFFRLSESSKQAGLHKTLQHVINGDCFYKSIMDQIISECPNFAQKRKLQAIALQYLQFMMRRADIKAGISEQNSVIDVLAHESGHALNAPVNYMKELLHMIEQQKRISGIRLWQKECELSSEMPGNTIHTEAFSDSDDDWTDAEEYNNRLQFTGVDF